MSKLAGQYPFGSTCQVVAVRSGRSAFETRFLTFGCSLPRVIQTFCLNYLQQGGLGNEASFLRRWHLSWIHQFRDRRGSASEREGIRQGCCSAACDLGANTTRSVAALSRETGFRRAEAGHGSRGSRSTASAASSFATVRHADFGCDVGQVFADSRLSSGPGRGGLYGPAGISGLLSRSKLSDGSRPHPVCSASVPCSRRWVLFARRSRGRCSRPSSSRSGTCCSTSPCSRGTARRCCSGRSHRTSGIATGVFQSSARGCVGARANAVVTHEASSRLFP